MERRPRTWWLPALAGLLLVLLLVLGVLQVHWIDALGAAEAERLRHFVSTGVERVAVDLDRALAQVESAFHDMHEASVDELARVTEEWRRDARFPGLIATVHWVDPFRPPSPHGEDPGALDAGRRPAPEAWRRAIEQLLPDGAATPADLQLPDDPPGLLVPILRPGLDGSGRPHFLLVLLDRDAVSLALQALVHEHIGQAFGDAVRVGVTHGSRWMYGTPADLTRDDLDQPDALVRVGGGRSRLDGRGDGSLELVRSGSAEQQEQDVLEVERHTQLEAASPARLLGAAQPLALAYESPSWEVRASHRAGSVAAAASALRSQNLAVGFGVLAILAAATVLLVVAARRARRLAGQQVAFVAEITHELRTPLTVIRGAAENLKDDLVSDPEQARRYGRMIHDEGRRLSDLVEQALALAGVHQDPTSLRPVPVDLGELLTATAERFLAGASLPPDAVQLDLPAGAPRVLADPRGLEHAVSNLLGNAFKYGAPEASMARASVILEVSAAAPGRIDIAVRDRGPGVPAHEQRRVFEPFFRGEAARTSRTPGSGLGLAVVRRLVEAMGGEVSLVSEPGAGSTFTLHLPAAPGGAPR